MKATKFKALKRTANTMTKIALFVAATAACFASAWWMFYETKAPQSLIVQD